MSESDDEDALIASLEEEADQITDPAVIALRASRMQALATELSRAKIAKSEGYGTYGLATNEQDLLNITTTVPRCIVHFFKSDFNRCRVMDGHLQTIAEQHLETRIVRMDVQHAPFLVTKLQVKILPCVIGFVKGVSADRIVGFEGLTYGSASDDFETTVLERRLQSKGLLDKLGAAREHLVTQHRDQFPTSKSTSEAKYDSEEDVSDWD